RIKSGGGRSPASKRWLERQLNDPYVARAKREGFPSRAAFKLIEIDDKHHLLKQGARVVDLAAAPGGWSQVAAQRRGSGQGGGDGERGGGGGKSRGDGSLGHGAYSGRRIHPMRLSRSARTGSDQGPARRSRRRRALRHGGECDRPPPDRPSQDHGARGGRG